MQPGQVGELTPACLIQVRAPRIALGIAGKAGLVVMPAVHHVFPLADHAEKTVVEHEHLQGNAIADHGRQLLDVHLEAAVAVDQDHRLGRVGEPGADGRRETKTHRPQTPRAHPLARPGESVVLRRPHLVLTDAGYESGIALGELRDGLDDRLRLDVVRLGIGFRHLLAPCRDLRAPGWVLSAAAGRQGVIEEFAELRDQVHVGLDHLIDLGGVYVHMCDALARSEALDRDAIVEPGAQGEDQIRLAQGVVRRNAAVHARHPQVETVLEGNGAEGIEGSRDRRVETLHKPAQAIRRFRVNDSATHLDDGTLGLGEGAEDRVRVGGLEWHRVSVTLAGRIPLAEACKLCILADVHQDRPGSSRLCQCERLAQDPLQVAYVLHQVVVLRDGPRDANGVHLLEGVGPDRKARHLPRHEDRRNRVLVSVGNWRRQIGRPRPGSGHGDPHPAADAGIAFRGVPRPPFLPTEYEPRGRLLAQHPLIELHM